MAAAKMKRREPVLQHLRRACSSIVRYEDYFGGVRAILPLWYKSTSIGKMQEVP